MGGALRTEGEGKLLLTVNQPQNKASFVITEYKACRSIASSIHKPKADKSLQ